MYSKRNFPGVTVLLMAFLLTLVMGCKNDKSEDKPDTPTVEKPPVKVPPFNRDSAYTFVQRQVDFGPRVMGSKGHEDCKNWIIGKMRSYGMEITEQNFEAAVYTGDKFPATNIIAKYKPDNTNRIVLAAHWDTRHIADSDLSTRDQDKPILGADDGGSGVGVLIELARQFSIDGPDMGVDFVFLDAEDYGDSTDPEPTEEAEIEKRQNSWAIGAQYYAHNFSGIRPKYGILLDMVGSAGATFHKEDVSMHFAPGLVNGIWSTAIKMGYGTYFINKQEGFAFDDHYFINTIANIPMVDIINMKDKKFGAHWHTHDDNMKVIDRNTLRAVGQVLLAVVYRDELSI
ncbi:MAG: M28 family peptidase [Saprospiraceae bacterium]|nr:M28 family peptidase [Saprospiraceae bacterium]MCB9326921.1 M28 family peptidase [Lewinellaceae bacterium]